MARRSRPRWWAFFRLVLAIGPGGGINTASRLSANTSLTPASPATGRDRAVHAGNSSVHRRYSGCAQW